MQLSTNEILTTLRTFQGKESPTAEDLQNVNYPFYAAAPYWLRHQTVCLIAEISPIDEETFYTLMSLGELELKINLAHQQSKKSPKDNTIGGQQSFNDYVMKYFPIPSNKIHLLKNLNEWLQKAIKTGSIQSIIKRINGSNTTLLDPKLVIHSALQNKISIPTQLLECMETRNTIELLHLPNIFPDEIWFNAPYNSARIKHNKTIIKPTQPSSSVVVTTFDNKLHEIVIEIQKEELVLPITQFLLHFASPRGDALNDRGLAQLKKRLQDYPTRQVLFRRETWSPEEAVLAYHNISLRIFEDVTQGIALTVILRRIIELLDKEEEIFQNYINFLASKNQRQVPAQIPLYHFINFLIEKGYKIPAHFPKDLQKKITSSVTNEPNADTVSSHSPGENKPSKKRINDPLVLRKDYFINLARIEWWAETKQIGEGKRQRPSHASELIRRPFLQKHAIEFYIKLGLLPLKQEADELEKYNKIKDDETKLREYLKELGKQTPEALIDPAWLSPHSPKHRQKNPKRQSKTRNRPAN